MKKEFLPFVRTDAVLYSVVAARIKQPIAHRSTRRPKVQVDADQA